MTGLAHPPALARRQLSHAHAFIAVAFAFATVTAFSTTPSSLYGIYERQQGFSLTTITFTRSSAGSARMSAILSRLG